MEEATLLLEFRLNVYLSNVYQARLLRLFCGKNYQYRPRFQTETRRAHFPFREKNVAQDTV
jgi:hypothetical protein